MRNQVDQSTRLLVVGGIIGAILGCGGAIIGGLASGFFTYRAAIDTLPPTNTPLPTATPVPTQTPVPPTLTPVPTPTPSSDQEAVLLNYLSALESKRFEDAANLLSNYSLTVLIPAFKQNFKDSPYPDFESGVRWMGHKIVDQKEVESGISMRFKVEVEVSNADGSMLVQTHFFTVHKDDDGIWRVNANGIVDYRLTEENWIYWTVKGEKLIGVTPWRVIRFEDSTIVYVSWQSVTGFLATIPDQSNRCILADGNARTADISFPSENTFTLKMSGYQQTYPKSCDVVDITQFDIPNGTTVAYVEENFWIGGPQLTFTYK